VKNGVIFLMNSDARVRKVTGGAISTVVGTGASATPRVRAALEAALAALGAAPLAFEAGPLEVTVYAEARLLADLARAVHARLLG